MGVFRTIVDLVTGLAWPIAVVWIVLAFRREIRDVLHARKASVKAGPFELGFEQALVEVEAAVASGGEVRRRDRPGVATPLGLDEAVRSLAGRAETSPIEVVIGAFALVERALRDRLAVAGVDVADARTAVQLASLAASAGLITPETVNSVQGVAVLRNLAAHGHGGEIDREKALDYLALIEGTLYAIHQTPR